MKAFVSEGRWVVFCGDADCGAAEEQWRPEGDKFTPVGLGDGPQMLRRKPDGTPFGIRGDVAYCGNCGNQTLIEWPSNRDEIAAALKGRPVPQTRNWYPGETVEDLVEENAAHGLD